MTIVHGYLLGGLVLLGVPILVHLIMRQKPRVLPFPAFRFLKQRRRINQRRLRLQHLLLMLLRMAVIAALCLGLAMMGSSEQSSLLVLDTSPSLEYRLGEQPRLEELRQQALGLVGLTSQDSRTALCDGGSVGDPAALWQDSPALVTGRLESLRVRPTRLTLIQQLEQARPILEQAAEVTRQPLSLYVFSDFTRSSWGQTPAGPLALPERTRVILADVGVDSPLDLAIDRLEVRPEVVAPGAKVRIEATVRATGSSYNSELLCSLDREPEPGRPVDRRALQLNAGELRTIAFEREAPPLPAGGQDEVPCQVTVQLATSDALPFNNTRHATFLVRRPRQVLIIAERPELARPWALALQVVGLERPAEAFACEVVTPAEAEQLTAAQWEQARVVCLFEVPRPSAGLWDRLARRVRSGAGLVIVPGGAEMEPHLAEHNAEGKRAGVLPGELRLLVQVPVDRPGVPWREFRGGHPITAPFRQWLRTVNPDFSRPQYQPLVNSYWHVEPLVGPEGVLAAYDDEPGRPALLERPLGKGHVILLTVPMDGRALDAQRGWHNYWKDSSFGLVLADQVCSYLAGEASRPQLAWSCGQPVQVRVPTPAPPLPYTLQGAGLSVSETAVQATAPGSEEPLSELALPQAVGPGNYVLFDGQDRMFAGFSLNMPAEESRLERVPVAEIEKLLGRKLLRVVEGADSSEADTVPVGEVQARLEEGAAVLVQRPLSPRELEQRSQAPWRDALPWMMMGLLLALALESLLANRFYRRSRGGPAIDPGPPGRTQP